MRLTGFGKFVVLLALLAAGAVAGAAGAYAMRPHASAWRCVVVRPGDTLWKLASGSRGDPRPAVDRVIHENQLNGAAIYPGMALWVPWDDPGAVAPRECQS